MKIKFTLVLLALALAASSHARNIKLTRKESTQVLNKAKCAVPEHVNETGAAWICGASQEDMAEYSEKRYSAF